MEALDRSKAVDRSKCEIVKNTRALWLTSTENVHHVRIEDIRKASPKAQHHCPFEVRIEKIHGHSSWSHDPAPFGRATWIPASNTLVLPIVV
jgi:hypothetical protein